MTVTVLAILETDFVPEHALGKVMNERLKNAANQLKEKELVSLESMGQRSEDVVIYMSYNPKYTIRWRIVNDVPQEVEQLVARVCGALGYIEWKTATLNIFKGNE